MDRNSIFSETQCDLLFAILNRIIPEEGNRPGAGDPPGVSAIEAILRTSARMRRSFLDGLTEVRRVSWQGYDADFVDLAPEDQDRVLTSIERDQPSFFDLLVYLTYRSYYQNGRHSAKLGLELRPPQPVGFTLPPFSAERLDRVRARGKLYRDTPP